MRYPLFPVVAAVLVLASPAVAKVKITPVTITESRTKELAQSEAQKNAFLQSGPGGLVVTIRLEGKEVEGALEFGKLKIAEALDDTGASLKPEAGGGGFGGGDGFRKFSFGRFDDSEPAETLIPIELKLPARKATKLTKLKGEVSVKAGGEKKVVSATKLTALKGKNLKDPALTEAKLKVQLADEADADANLGPADSTLMLKIIGDSAAIQKIELVDAQGETVSQGHSSSTFGNKTDYGLFISKPVDDSMTLKIELVVGQKVVKVPFDLKDIPLP